MVSKREYYEILGVKKTSTEKEIKSAYRKLAKKYHPDTNTNNKQAEQLFKEITEAYNVLSDPEKRKLYDSYGFAGLEPGFDPNFAGYTTGYSYGESPSGFNGDAFKSYTHFSRSSPDGSYQEFHFSGGDGADIFGDILGSMFGDASQYQKSAYNSSHFKGNTSSRFSYNGNKSSSLKKGWEQKGNDVYVTVNIPFETAVLGGEAIIPTLTGKVSCKIKAGTKSGTKVRLRGKGLPDPINPSVKGDEYAVIQIEVPRNLSSEKLKKLKEYASA